jgi:uncharacterized cupin superfamily protein
MVQEARLVRTENGLEPEGEGWYVLNAREAKWYENDEFGSWVNFEGDVRFAQVGFNVAVLAPGQPACMYHGEEDQEAFLMLAGEAVLLVEGEERPLRAWDFFHCPPWTEHVIVGAGDGPCVFVGVGARTPGSKVVYPRADVALRHGAGVEEETDSGDMAYAATSEPQPRPYREGDLPGWE